MITRPLNKQLQHNNDTTQLLNENIHSLVTNSTLIKNVMKE